MTVEAIDRVVAAAGPADLFGAGPADDARREYRRLAQLVHPDANPRDARATGAFAKLAALWQQRQAADGALVASGDIANLVRVPGGLLKLARDPADADLMGREAAALDWIDAVGDPEFLPDVPEFRGMSRHPDPVTGAVRHGNLLRELKGFVSIEEVSERFPGGLDPRDVAWIWRRTLVAIGFAHRCGLVHGAAVAPHILIEPAEHGVVLADFCYSCGGPNPGTLPAVVARYRSSYPPEVGAGYQPGPDHDIYTVTRTLAALCASLPAPLERFVRACTLPSAVGRPKDAWEVLRDFDEIIERLWGKRTFRIFPVLNAR